CLHHTPRTFIGQSPSAGCSALGIFLPTAAADCQRIQVAKEGLEPSRPKAAAFETAASSIPPPGREPENRQQKTEDRNLSGSVSLFSVFCYLFSGPVRRAGVEPAQRCRGWVTATEARQCPADACPRSQELGVRGQRKITVLEFWPLTPDPRF